MLKSECAVPMPFERGIRRGAHQVKQQGYHDDLQDALSRGGVDGCHVVFCGGPEHKLSGNSYGRKISFEIDPSNAKRARSGARTESSIRQDTRAGTPRARGQNDQVGALCVMTELWWRPPLERFGNSHSEDLDSLAAFGLAPRGAFKVTKGH